MNTTHPITRRDFVRSVSVGALAMAGLAPSQAQEPKSASPLRMPDSPWSAIRGFNYQPSYGSNGFELWQKFNARIIATELDRGKKFFPKMNGLRWWQSWDSFKRDPKRYARDFETTLVLAAKRGLKVMPCLFNRWHDAMLDYGGIYVDHFLPRASWVQKPKMFDAFLEALVGGHKDDPRILAWDLCNEPFAYLRPAAEMPDIDKAELDWLKGLYDACKKLGAQATITVGIHPGVPLEKINPVSDLLSIHPYFVHNNPKASKADYEKSLDRDVAFALKTGKPLLATECCWGALDDKMRVESVRYTLTQLKARNIGWLVYLLHHSLIADAHRSDFGPLSGPGNLAFIEASGSLRPGHGVFNEF
ncbi:MAG: cellulase family glycosylhydrolase [Verrucomicrobia bacterium]|nr:cellulase family glycosylhydrolase [Verrucomicrobiota bacterium]